MLEKTREKNGIDHIAITVRKTISASESVVYAGYLIGNEFAVTPMFKTGVIVLRD